MKFYPDKPVKFLNLIFRKQSFQRGGEKAKNAPRKSKDLTPEELRDRFRIRL